MIIYLFDCMHFYMYSTGLHWIQLEFCWVWWYFDKRPTRPNSRSLLDGSRHGVFHKFVCNLLLNLNLLYWRHRVVDDKEELFFNVYTVEPMESSAIKRTVYKKNLKIHSQYDYRSPVINYKLLFLSYSSNLNDFLLILDERIWHCHFEIESSAFQFRHVQIGRDPLGRRQWFGSHSNIGPRVGKSWLWWVLSWFWVRNHLNLSWIRIQISVPEPLTFHRIWNKPNWRSFLALNVRLNGARVTITTFKSALLHQTPKFTQ